MAAEVNAVTRPLASMVTTGTVVELPMGPLADPIALSAGFGKVPARSPPAGPFGGRAVGNAPPSLIAVPVVLAHTAKSPTTDELGPVTGFGQETITTPDPPAAPVALPPLDEPPPP